MANLLFPSKTSTTSGCTSARCARKACALAIAISLALPACSTLSLSPDSELTSLAPPATEEASTEATSLPTRTLPPTRTAPSKTSSANGERGCGDGICDGPETVETCPEDCEATASPPSPAPDGLPPLYLGLSVHLEGYPLGNNKIGYNEEVYARYSERILAYSDLANRYDMPITWETANLIGPSETFEPNVLLELYQRGDGVGVHADLGGNDDRAVDEDAFTFELRKLRAQMEDMGIPVVHASGICSELDWVTGARKAGFQATSGAVNYCLRALPVDQQPEVVRTCAGPGDGACHDPYPGEFPAALHPWRAADGSSWTTPADEGLLIVPTVGTIHGIYEAKTGSDSHTHNQMTREDVEVARQVIEEGLAARSRDQLNAFFFVWSFGQAIDEALLHAFFSGVQPYVERGDVVWQTLPELIETYETAE